MANYNFFAACCCAESKENEQVVYSSNTDEAHPAAYTGAGPVKSDQVLSGQQSPLAEKAAEARRERTCSDQDRFSNHHTPRNEPFSARSLSPEEKEAEKARLQQLVNSFAKRAVRGCMCTYVREGSGVRNQTQYRIDKSLEYLVVVATPGDGQTAEVTCPISAIQDIYSLAEDGAECFPPEVVAGLQPEERDLLLMVVYRSGEKMFRFCLLEQSVESRDAFLECLRILCIYAQSGPGAPPRQKN